MEGVLAGLWTDCHNHLQLHGDREAACRWMEETGARRCVVNATREEDWNGVAELAAAYPGRMVAAYGIHPWHAGKAMDGWQRRLRERLAEDPRATVGECGLDGVVAVDRSLQSGVFRDHLRIAREMGRVVTVHCVRAWGGVLDALEEITPPRFLMHGYGGSVEMAGRFAAMGGWFSANACIPRSKALAVLRALPVDRIVLESDAGAGGGSPCPRPPDPGAELGAVMGRGVDELRHALETNASRLFDGSFG